MKLNLTYRPVITPSANFDYVREPQWRLREGESARFSRTYVEDEHDGLECVVERHLMGYITAEGERVDTRGGAYAVRFPCGCGGLVFEHELRRDDETPFLQ